jgi:hypothetical protein
MNEMVFPLMMVLMAVPVMCMMMGMMSRAWMWADLALGNAL